MNVTHLADVYDGDERIMKLFDPELVEEFKDVSWCTVEEIEE